MKKLAYETPEMEILQFESEDVIRTSSEMPSNLTTPDFNAEEWPSR